MQNQPNQPNKSSSYSFCLSSFLYNNFQNSKERTLIIDTRDAQSYSKRHIAGSINLTNQRIEEALKKKPTIIDQPRLALSDLTDMLRNDEASKFAMRKRSFCFLVMSENSLSKTLMQDIKRSINYDELEDSFQITENSIKSTLERTLEGNEERDSISHAFEIFRILQKDRVRELFLLLDGSLSFFTRYPYMANSIDPSPQMKPLLTRSLEFDFPHDILDGRLFLGSFNQSEKYSLVSNLKITHILNMTYECDNVHEEKGIKYLKVSILDEADKNIATHFEEAYQFIHEILHENKENNILVHCAMGKSRSATIIIMYLMKRFTWSYEKAFAFVKRKREIICLNEGFIQQLQNFEDQNLGFMGTL